MKARRALPAHVTKEKSTTATESARRPSIYPCVQGCRARLGACLLILIPAIEVIAREAGAPEANQTIEYSQRIP